MTVLIKLQSPKKEVNAVRKIEAIIRSNKLDALRKAFLDAGIQKMTVTEVRDYGITQAHQEIYRSDAFSVDSLSKVKVETIVPQNKVPLAVSILKTKGQTRNGEDERILVSSVNDVSQIYSNGMENPFDGSRE